LNFVNPDAYAGWNGELAGCINDARDMHRLATGLGYTATLLTDSQATAAAVTRGIGLAARALVSGDIFLVTYSGHGSQIPDVTGDEPDRQDETWVLWDRQLLDDELHGLWGAFAAGVRVLVLSDSCHSGTVARMTNFRRKFRSAEFAAQYDRPVNDAPRVRAADPAAIRANYERHRSEYEVSQWTHRAPIQASIVLISGCQDDQLSSDGDANGLFTQRLKEVWNDASFVGNYTQFHAAIVARMPSDQTPNLFRTGVTNPAFEAQKPFTIDSAAEGVISIAGPSAFPNDTTPITFAVSVPPGSFYAVEVATDPSLFNNAVSGSRRDDDNFYATWRVTPFLQGRSYTMPANAWNRLRRNASRLFYRLWVTASSNSWVGQQVTVLDSVTTIAPAVTLTASPDPGNDDPPTITAPSVLPDNGGPPRFQVNPGAGRYYAVEVSTNPWYFTPQYRPERNDDNFYGSWTATPLASSAIYPATFELPVHVWDRLRVAATHRRVFYRMWWTDSSARWVNQGCTTPDESGQKAPAITLSREL
jgi:hypothetical protein